MSRLFFALSLLMMLFAAALSGLWIVKRSQMEQARGPQQGPKPRLPQVLYPVPTFELTDHRDKPFGNKALDGKVWVVDFIFTRCQGPCPRMTATMASLQRWVPGLTLVTISADPKYDTPQVLADYAKQVGAGPNWHFLTGKWTAIHELAQQGFKVPVIAPKLGEPETLITHGTRLILVGPKGGIRGYYTYNDSKAVEQLVADAKKLLANQ